MDRFSHLLFDMVTALQLAERLDDLAEQPPDLPGVGDSIGPYRILELLGQGGMANVYRARLRSGVGPEVVVKSMLPHLAKVPALVEMFAVEARLTSQLQHRNIVRVENHGVHAGTPYLTMELLDGRNLSQLRLVLRRSKRRMPIAIAMRIAHDLGAALGCAHAFVDPHGRQMQIIHRDVSPSNVMVGRDGSVKLLDFGVARLSSAAGHVITRSLKGKFAYMAPEQVNELPVDRRCDVFAAGIVLHEMLTNRRLFAGKSERETLRRVSAVEALAPSLSNAAVPPELDEIVMRALSPRPEDRFDSGKELAEALASLGSLASTKEVAAFIARTVPVAAGDTKTHVLLPLGGTSATKTDQDDEVTDPACQLGVLVLVSLAQVHDAPPPDDGGCTLGWNDETEKAKAKMLASVEVDVSLDGPSMPRWDRVLLGLAFVSLAISLAVGLA